MKARRVEGVFVRRHNPTSTTAYGYDFLDAYKQISCIPTYISPETTLPYALRTMLIDVERINCDIYPYESP